MWVWVCGRGVWCVEEGGRGEGDLLINTWSLGVSFAQKKKQVWVLTK